MKDPYEVLGISKNATDDEVKAAYRALARKYHPDNFEDTNPLKELANEKMQQINEAYDEIMRMRSAGTKGQHTSNASRGEQTGSVPPFYADIRHKINHGKISQAEQLLLTVDENERIAEWHYLYSIVLFKRGRVNDAMRSLEIACMMDPSNAEYQQAKQMFNTGANGYGSTYYGANQKHDSSGGCCNGCDDCCTCGCQSGDACDCCSNLILCDCLCECCGGDLIPCL